jgi:hypothetical protein
MTANTAATARSGSELSDTALIILGAAAQREDRLLLPVPTSISVSPEIISKTIKSLVAKSMVEERPAKLEDLVWRKDEQDQNYTLFITDTGVAALDGHPGELDQGADARELANECIEAPQRLGKESRP